MKRATVPDRVVGLPLAVAPIALATLLPARGNAFSLAAVWCLTCRPIWLADAISNVILFLPLGVVLGALGMRTSRALLTGAVVSLGIELLQLSGFPSGRSAAPIGSPTVRASFWEPGGASTRMADAPFAAGGTWFCSRVGPWPLSRWWAIDWALGPSQCVPSRPVRSR
ncbi:MAG: VanZ family protein [Gemmatimonadaceae bacterium]|nr:VanZ family protein [Gemmatimonadaceae bacterium]